MNLEKYKKIDFRKKIIISSFIFPLIILGLVLFVAFPTIKDIKKMRDEIEAQRVDLEKKYIKGQSLKKLSEDLKEIEPELHKLDKMFIDKEKVLEFITTLEETANAENVSQKINLSPAQGEGYFLTTPLQIFTSGNFLRQVNYLTKLEALNYYINIKSFEISAAAPAKNAPKDAEKAPESSVNMLFSADTYWQ